MVFPLPCHEGLTFEMSALETLYAGQFALLFQLIKLIFFFMRGFKALLCSSYKAACGGPKLKQCFKTYIFSQIIEIELNYLIVITLHDHHFYQECCCHSLIVSFISFSLSISFPRTTPLIGHATWFHLNTLGYVRI